MSTTRVVGRDRELAELDTALSNATSGRGSLYLITGEAGIGKSTLADTLAARASQAGATVLWGRCWEGGGAPAYWPWVQILRTTARDADKPRGEQASLLAQIVPEIAETEQPVQRAPEEARFALFDAVSRFVLEQTAPLVVILEDLHAADIPSLLLLRFFASASKAARALVIGTYREAEANADPAIASVFGDIAREATSIPLRGLSADAIGDLLTHVAGAARAPELADTIHNATGGNPFFVDGVVRLLAAEGRLEKDAPTERLGIPDGVRAAILRRLGKLSAEANEMLQIASVAGRDFNIEVVAIAAGETRARAIEIFEEPARAGILRADSPDRLVFSHALIRDALYETQTSQRRAQIHLSIVDAIERAHANDIEPYLSELSHHAFAAASSGGAERAVMFAERAGARALASLAYEDAAMQYERALDALDRCTSDDARRAELTLGLADALGRSGELARARREHERAIDLARRSTDARLLARATLALGEGQIGGLWVQPWLPDKDWIGMLERARDAIGPDDVHLRARVLAHLSVALYFTDRHLDGAEMASEAVTIAEKLEDDGTLALCLTARHMAAWGPDNLDERRALAERIIDLAEAAAKPELKIQALIWLVADLMEMADIGAARAVFERYLALVEQLRRPQHRAYATLTRALFACLDGKLDEALALNTESRARAEAIGDEGLAVSSYVQLLHIYRELGRVDEIADIMRGFSRRFEGGTSWTVAQMFMMRLFGKKEDVAGGLKRASGALARRDTFYLSNLGMLADVGWHFGLEDLAAALLPQLEPYADRYLIGGRNAVVPNGSAARAIGLFHATLGHDTEADTAFAHALEQARAMGSPISTARIETEWAASMLRRAQPDRARVETLLNEARALATATGATGLLQEIDALRAPPGQVLQREGDVWTVRHDGNEFRLPDRLGLQYLARLLENPKTEIHVLELMGSEVPREDGDVVLDEQARASYKRRLTGLQEALDDAKAAGDTEAAIKAEDEIDALTAELRAATGLGGRSRKIGSGAERARISVTKAIKGAIDQIEKRAPTLAAHLTTAVKTGTFCSYAPDRAS